jgi:hypothetical protein
VPTPPLTTIPLLCIERLSCAGAGLQLGDERRATRSKGPGCPRFRPRCVTQSSEQVSRHRSPALPSHLRRLKRAQHDSITHVRIGAKIIRELLWSLLVGTTGGVVVLDAPLLFESKLHLLCDCSVVVVCSDEARQLQRCMLRDGLTLEHARARLQRRVLNYFFCGVRVLIICDARSLIICKM